MKDIIRLLCAITLATLVFVVYRDFTITGVGISHRNDCGTYDRWVVWADNPDGPMRVLMFPNGVFGKDSKSCKEVK